MRYVYSGDNLLVCVAAKQSDHCIFFCGIRDKMRILWSWIVALYKSFFLWKLMMAHPKLIEICCIRISLVVLRYFWNEFLSIIRGSSSLCDNFIKLFCLPHSIWSLLYVSFDFANRIRHAFVCVMIGRIWILIFSAALLRVWLIALFVIVLHLYRFNILLAESRTRWLYNIVRFTESLCVKFLFDFVA